MIKCPECKNDISENGIFITQQEIHNSVIYYSKDGEYQEIEENYMLNPSYPIKGDNALKILSVSCNNCGAELDLTYDELHNQLPKKIREKKS